MQAMKNITLLLFLALLSGCSSRGHGLNETEGDTYSRIIALPSHESVQVTFGNSSAFICNGVQESLLEINRQIEQPKPYENGFVYLDVINNISNYRAYFIQPRRGPITAFIMCSGAGTRLDGNSCSIVGVSGEECFETAVLDWPADANEMQFIIKKSIEIAGGS
jgi:hypothetical protein